MKDKVILRVEDNARDEALTLRALEQSNIAYETVVVRDGGVEALDYLFCTGEFEGRDPKILPQLILLDLKPPSCLSSSSHRRASKRK